MSQSYSIYVIGDDGRFRKRVDVVFDNDAEAKNHAEQIMDGRSVEVWQQGRRVFTLKPEK